MLRTTPEERRRLEGLDRPALEDHQLSRLNALLAEILPLNSFYGHKLAGLQLPLKSLGELASLPFTTKDELLAASPAARIGTEGPIAGNLTYPMERYIRFHQTSGTRGRPLVVLDTADDWQWWLDCWQFVLDAAGVTAGDRLLLAFSFGPFVGFWSAFEAAAARGCLVLPGGGMSTLARLELLRSCRVKALFCTPSYALHMAEVAAEHGIATAELGLRTLVLAGEPGGSLPATRQRLEEAWNARVLDHAGASEVGPWGFGDVESRGLHVIESEFIAEFLLPQTGQPADGSVSGDGTLGAGASAEGALSELVLTNLGRRGFPVVRYRTGDMVRPLRAHGLDNRFVLLDGGVLGRADNMLIVRGVNVFPSALEQIVRGFSEVVEYRVTAFKAGELDQLEIEIEDRLDRPERVAEELRLRLGLKVNVSCVAAGTLPRFEGKGERFVDRRNAT